MSYDYNNQGSPNGQSSLSGEAILAEKTAQAQKEKLKKKYRITSFALIGVIVVAVAALLMTQLNSGPPEQLEWSEWSESLPDYATEEFYNIEEQTVYRMRNLETTSSTENSKAGWELYDTIEGAGAFGPWSDWSTSQVSGGGNREVESQTRYRYRDKETNTDTASTLSGWELYDTSYTLGDFGSWSSWSTSPVTANDSRKVEKKTQYRYRDISTTTSSKSSLDGWELYDTSVSYGNWSAWSTTPVSESRSLEVEMQEVEIGSHYYLGHYCTGNVPGAQWQTSKYNDGPSATFNNNCVFHELGWFNGLGSFEKRDGGGYIYYPGGSKYICSNSCWTWYIYEEDPIYECQYRSRSVNYTYYYRKTGSWSSWSDAAVSASSTKDVEKRTVYRYCDRAQIPTYHFWRWGDWTDWSTDASSSSDNRQVETASYYRYRERQWVTTYYFQRWTDWSEYTTEPAQASDTVEVQTITQYRFKSKGN